MDRNLDRHNSAQAWMKPSVLRSRVPTPFQDHVEHLPEGSPPSEIRRRLTQEGESDDDHREKSN